MIACSCSWMCQCDRAPGSYRKREPEMRSSSPRRYVCASSHVPQTVAQPLVPNTFVDMDALRGTRAAAQVMGVIGKILALVLGASVGAGRRHPAGDHFARVSDARWLRFGGGLLGRLQHPPGGDQHREVLRLLPRDGTNVLLEEMQGLNSRHQPLRRARQVSGLPRAARMDRQDRPQDAGLEGGVGPHLRQHIETRDKFLDKRLASGAARMGAHEGQQLARMPQLPLARGAMDLSRQNPRAAFTHEASLFTKEKTWPSTTTRASPTTCPTCRGVPGWQ